MTSKAKLEANRKNSLLSTGPKTPEGQRAIRLNALKHGLTCSDVVVTKTESIDEYHSFHETLMAHFRPQGPIEEFLVDRITTCQWRLRRVVRCEAQQLMEDEPWPSKNTSLLEAVDTEGLIKYETSISRELYRALGHLERLQAVRLGRATGNHISVDVLGME